MCTSGQFLHRRVANYVQTRPGATGAVAVCDFFLYLVEVVELGARLATTLECETGHNRGSLQRRHGQAVDLGGLEARPAWRLHRQRKQSGRDTSS